MVQTKKKICPNCGLETDNEVIYKWHYCNGVNFNKLIKENEEGEIKASSSPGD